MPKIAFSKIDDQIALMKSPVLRKTAQVAFRTTKCVCNFLAKSALVVGSGVVLLFRCTQHAFASIPSYAKNILFPAVPAPQKESEKFESLLNRWMRGNLQTPLNPSQKESIRKAIEGSLSPEKEVELINAILGQRRPNPADDATDRRLLTEYLQQARVAAAQEKLDAVSPLERIKDRQKTERAVLAELEKKLKLIDPQIIHRRVDDPSEAPYLEARGEFIRRTVPNFDLGALLWGDCAGADLGRDLEQEIDQFQQGLTEEGKTLSQVLLEVEYCALLRQRLALSRGISAWDRQNGHIVDLNDTALACLGNLRDAIEQRWDRTKALMIPANAATQKIDTALAAFKGLNPREDLPLYFKRAQELMADLHQLELQFLKKPCDLERYFTQTGALSLEDAKRRFETVIDIPQRQELLGIEEAKERKAKRHQTLSKELLLACLKETADGQQLIRLMGLRPPYSKGNWHLYDAACKAFEALHSKASPRLTNALYSTPEFVADIERGVPMPSLAPLQEHTWERDISALGRTLDLKMDAWHKALQEIWMSHLSLEQEKEIRALSGKKREEKMSELFARWMLEKTALPFTRALSFKHLKLPNQEKVRAEALKTIKKLPRGARPPAADRADAPAFRGAPLESIALDAPLRGDSRIVVAAAPFDVAGAHLLAAPRDLVTVVKESPEYDPRAPLAARIDWVVAASRNPIYVRGLKNGSLSIYRAFFDIARDLAPAPASPALLDAFLDFVLGEHAFRRDNIWRKEVLGCYLQMIFAGEGLPIQVSEEERKYLVQMATLAEVPLPNLVVVAGADQFFRKGLPEVGRAVQQSEIGLEGLEEDIIQRSIQQSDLPQNAEMRKFIDALRARHGEHLAESLLPSVLQAYPLDHDQGQQAIIRAISYAFHGRQDALIAYVTDLLGRQPPAAEIDARTMALPARIFLLDYLVSNLPVVPPAADPFAAHRAELEAFNQGLMNSNNAPKMLMGFAREISRLARIFTANPTPETFANLLRVKIAYQALKGTHFDGRVVLRGFLKLAVDQAESSMASSLIEVKDFARGLDPAVLLPLLLAMDADPARRTFAERAVERAFRIQQERGLPVTYQAPFFLSFGRSDLDLVSGFVYFDGQENAELPAHLQNHPHVRSLGLHDLPYVRNDDGSYSHFTTEGGRRIAQVRITMNPAREIIIQRRLATHFAPPERVGVLQYLPLEKFTAIPAALAQRMGVREFWKAQNNTIYGYTEKGALVLSVTPDETIRTSAGSFKFSERVALAGTPSEEVFNYLRQALPADEILSKRDLSGFWVPSLDLMIDFDPADNSWNCTSPNVSGMVLDLDQPLAPSLLGLKRKEGAAKAALQALKDQLTILRKHLGEAEAIAGPSLFNKAEIDQIKKDILKTEAQIAQMDARLYVAVLPEQQPGTSHRAALARQVRVLADLSRQIAETADPVVSRDLQAQYLAAQHHYRELNERYLTTSATARRAAFLETSNPEHVLARDLAGSAFLVVEELKRWHPPLQMNSRAWIQELAKHPFSQPLDQRTFDLVQEAAHSSFSRRDELTLYLHLLLCQNAFFHSQEIAKTLSPDQEGKLREAQDRYRDLRTFCEEIARERRAEFPSEIRALLHTHCPGIIPPEAHGEAEVAPFPEIAGRELLGLSQQSFLERLALSPLVVSHPKDHASDISDAQKRLLRSFKTHSADQVAGFYLEEFGLFSVKALEREFNVDEAGNGLFGLNRAHLAAIFESMKSKGWIEQRSAQDFLFSVAASRAHPLALGQKEDLLAILADLPLRREDREQIATRLHTFLFQAAHSSFAFSWKDAAAVKTFNAALEAEREAHEAKMLDAKFFLQERLDAAGISLIEFKRRVLSKDHRGLAFDRRAPAGETPDEREARELANFAAARNAFLRYLFHKTEMQHLDNVAKAPLQGERNQIELLSTARQYPIDLLLREAANDQEEEERMMQLAFLLFEESYGARCNAMQIKLFRSLMLNPENPEAITAMQARMGFGKTALLPLLALLQLAKEAHQRPEERSLVRYVVPKAVLQDNAAAFDERIGAILGSNVLKDREFARYQIDPENKERSLRWILGDLRSRLDFYENARDKGLVLIQSPEIRQSMEAQELAFGFLVLSAGRLSDDERTLCMQCKQMLGRIRSLKTYTIFDELDATQDFKACEVNFTEGGKLPISQHAIRPLSWLIACVAAHREAPRAELARAMLGDLGLPEDRLFRYVTDPKQAITPGLRAYLDGLQAAHPEQHAGVFLIRAILLDPNFLAFASNKEPSTHFGARFIEEGGRRIYSRDPESEAPLLIAVPYDGANTPKGMSTFDNTEVAAIATMRYYLSGETLLEKEPHLDFLVTQTKKQRLPAFLTDIVRDVHNPARESFTDRLMHLSGLLDAAEIEQAKERFYQEFLRNPSPAVRSYFGMAVVATQVRTDEARANSNRYEMGSPEDQIRGCSGTVSSTSSYFERAATDPAADAKLSLEIMGRDNNAPIAVLAPIAEDEADYLGHVLGSLLAHAKPETRAIIDAAGICKSRDGTPETIVAQLWTRLQADPTIQGIEGIVYYGKDNVKRLYRGPGRPAIPCTTAMELAALPQKKYFSFYGQKNTRGSDIKQADRVHALVTMDENVPNNDAKQAVLRFRSLVQRSSGQTFTFVLTDRFNAMLRAINGGRAIDAKDVAKDLRRRELEGERHDALLLFRKELQAHVKQAAAYAEHQIFSGLDLANPAIRATYLQFLRERNDQIIPMVERAVDALEDKYGGSLRDIPRDEFVAEQIALFHGKLDELRALSERTIGALGAGEAVDLIFFHRRIGFSQRLFESRYPQDQNVEISVVDAAAEAVAMALAQAQAQAQAQALAERITENVIENLDRLPDLRLAMTGEPHFVTEDAWFANPVGAPIDDFRELRSLIRPNLRQQIQLSPHMQQRRIVSHFALIPNDAARPHLFISQEEAERWMSLPVAARSADYQLIDLRVDRYHPPLVGADSPLVLNMKDAVLRRTEFIPSPRTTADLRGTELTNVESRQLLPALLRDRGSDALFEKVNLGSFGVYKEGGPIQVVLDRKPGVLQIQAGYAHCDIPTENEWLRPIFEAEYGDPAPGKYRRVREKFERASEAFRRELEDLRRQQALMAARREAMHRLIQDASAFQINRQLEDGLKERDRECHGLRDTIIKNVHLLPDAVKDCGRDFLEMMGRIQAAQLALRGDPSQVNLDALQRVFGEFVSQRMSEFDGDFETRNVFDLTFWQANKATLPAFDRVYGRILHEVHGSNPASARGCGRDDCREMFSRTLPAMKTAIARIEAAAEALPGIQAEIDRIQAAIRVLEARAKSLEEADECMQQMECPEEFLDVFEDRGILLLERGEDPLLVWDRFRFADLHAWPEERNEATLEGRLPDFRKTLREGVREYQQRIHALNPEEEAVARDLRGLLTTSLALAQRVEPRQAEVEVV